MNAGLDAGPNQTWCGAGAMLGPDFGEILTSLHATLRLAKVLKMLLEVKNQNV